MSDTTLNVAQVRDLLKNAESLYALYNLIGRGYVSEFRWCDAYITGHLTELINRIMEEEYD